ncbi:MAG: hypothetical protein IKJ43_04880 [Bacilli bacterium]|nr:hypothetical protein [Bacilli bacterium]
MKENIVYYSIVNKKDKLPDTVQAQKVLKNMLDYFDLKLPHIYPKMVNLILKIQIYSSIILIQKTI